MPVLFLMANFVSEGRAAGGAENPFRELVWSWGTDEVYHSRTVGSRRGCGTHLWWRRLCQETRRASEPGGSLFSSP